MADAYGGVVGHWRAHVAAWITGGGQDYADIHSEVRFQAVDSWDYSSLNGNYGASVAGQTNRGSSSMGISVGANGEQTLVGKDLRIRKGRGGQNVSFDGYINITGYASGGSSAGGSIYIGGRPSHTITYNANGGSGAPGNQTKWYGESLFLSNTRPTRALYEFQGWALTQGSSNVDYRPGQQWFPDENRTLYAVWKLSIVAPTISSWSAIRCLSDGTPANDGTYAKVTCTWSVDTTADSNNKGSKLTVSYDSKNDANTISGTSGTFSKIYSDINISSSHTFIAALTDSHLNTTATTHIGPAQFILDINEDGTGVGVGQAAPVKGVRINGVFFANTVEGLPDKPEDIGGKGAQAFVNSTPYVWNGAGWHPQTIDNIIKDQKWPDITLSGTLINGLAYVNIARGAQSDGSLSVTTHAGSYIGSVIPDAKPVRTTNIYMGTNGAAWLLATINTDGTMYIKHVYGADNVSWSQFYGALIYPIAIN